MVKPFGVKAKAILPIYGLCAIVTLALIGSNFSILSFTSLEAHDIRERVERSLVTNEVDRQLAQMAHEQSHISYLDETVEAVQSEIDKSFLRTRIGGLLWKDFGIQFSIIIDPNNQPKAYVFEYDVQDPAKARQLIADNLDLITLAQDRYLAQRVSHDLGGFKLDAHPTSSENPIHAMGFRSAEGQLGLVAVQAIVPHSSAQNDDGPAHILLTFKPTSMDKLQSISANLGLGELQFVHREKAQQGSHSFLLPDDANRNQYVATWTISSPWHEIWASAVFPVSAFAIISLAALFVLSHRHASATWRLHMREEEARHRASHDDLTGLANRAHFDERVTQTLDDPHQPFSAVLAIDLDKFKAVNDTYGHAAGDDVIKAAARRIRFAIGDRGLAARIGGDEFAALITTEMSTVELSILGDLIIEQLKLAIPIEAGEAFIGGSIGIAVWSDPNTTAEQLLHQADMALYASKDAGRGRTTHFNPNMLASLSSDETPSNQSDVDANAA